MMNKLFINVSLAGTLTLLLPGCGHTAGRRAAAAPVGHAAPSIAAVRTDRARYAPGTPVIVAVTLTNPAGQPETSGSVRLAVTHLEDAVTPTPPAQAFRLAPGASRTLHFTWRPPPADFQGYTVSAQARAASGGVLDTKTTAVDVSSRWDTVPALRVRLRVSRPAGRGLRRRDPAAEGLPHQRHPVL